ncbi:MULTISPECIES: sulfurtransferase complex subunit TusC [Alteromonadaceae]|uniref:sulfurtransferase complex subunit TusC n=1 Tax=Alteromonadaceae TaxID=72275 RepID=UPI001C08AF79|nr:MULTISPECIES: sulfurtransferase complex subunit TusC [Aliiglaciecola]MBU2876398.1 sulfurtransferase complex subunit TusC [Aliiglaciecola lipolytica]MDO6712716.1 sulfurtransferase complex subunit TusC [Aliiglaciecola sp. 2_MG-2023]MDO6753885.1 sulfurtransferase complex subunit TusC [Aliiglaciecola sp. 1_MG-2023]
MKSLAIINQTGPMNNNAGQESVDLVLASASFGQFVSVFFIDDGVFQLLTNQNPGELEHKHFAKSFGAFEFYDVENIFVCKESLEKRGLDKAQLNVSCQLLTPSELNAQLQKSDNIITLS